MTSRDRITDYINSLDTGHGPLCDRIAREARENPPGDGSLSGDPGGGS